MRGCAARGACARGGVRVLVDACACSCAVPAGQGAVFKSHCLWAGTALLSVSGLENDRRSEIRGSLAGVQGFSFKRSAALVQVWVL